MAPDEFYVPDDAMMAEAAREQEQMALDALMRCEAAGSDPDALQTLAALLGLAGEWNQGRTTRPR